ncbi:MAG: PBP1A family penicillin-binding protein [Eubacterium sp.]|nr:PBP1A family penicillin-binding protein [Eubacterium sp.]
MAKKKKKKKYRRFWRFIRVQIVLLAIIVAGLCYYYLGGYAAAIQGMEQEAKSFVAKSNPETFKSELTSEIFDANGTRIAQVSGEKNVYYLELDQISENIQAAVISTEDQKFYQHKGVDYKAILRAVVAMIRNGEVTQGGSTITQQLARNVFLSQDKTWERKMEEIFLAIELEKKYSKSEILEYYLNNIYFGNGYYGIQAASRGYFSRDVDYLSLSEIAFLCAIPNNPTLYDPLEHPENTLKRRNRILDNMHEGQYITASACAQAKQEDIVLTPAVREKNNFAETYIYYCAIRQLMKQSGFQFQSEFRDEEEAAKYQEKYEEQYAQCQQEMFTKGYRIDTTIDLNLQSMLQESLDVGLSEFTETNEEGTFTLQGAAVCIDNQTGSVSAIVGGRSQETEGYTLNRAYQSFRQPGSAIKPLLVYTPMLERGMTPDSIVMDAPIEDGPENANGAYSGEITLRSAVASSKNTVAWTLLEELSPEAGLAYLKEMGFSKIKDSDYRLTSALGGFTTGASPLEMASGYAALENDGSYRAPDCIRKITASDGTEIYNWEEEEKNVYKENAARMMTSMLESVISDGTGRGIEAGGQPIAGKTGTTNDNKDGWFVGYSHYYTTSVWVGYDMPQELPGLSGSTYPGNIWESFMTKAHEGKQPIAFNRYVEYKNVDIENSGTGGGNETGETSETDTADETGGADDGTPGTDGGDADGVTPGNPR